MTDLTFGIKKKILITPFELLSFRNVYWIYNKNERGGFLCFNSLSIPKNVEFFRKGGPAESVGKKRISMNFKNGNISSLSKPRPILEMLFSEVGCFFTIYEIY